jgi:hypothetical protein
VQILRSTHRRRLWGGMARCIMAIDITSRLPPTFSISSSSSSLKDRIQPEHGHDYHPMTDVQVCRSWPYILSYAAYHAVSGIFFAKSGDKSEVVIKWVLLALLMVLVVSLGCLCAMCVQGSDSDTPAAAVAQSRRNSHTVMAAISGCPVNADILGTGSKRKDLSSSIQAMDKEL